jgi:alkylation response protein AidB-like acyl-CoA dehydrogenase
MASYLELNKGITEEESSIKDQIHRFGIDVLRPVASELDKMSPEDVIAEGSPLWDVFKQAYSLGYPKRGLPEALGGVRMSPSPATSTLKRWGGRVPISPSVSASPPSLQHGGHER